MDYPAIIDMPGAVEIVRGLTSLVYGDGDEAITLPVNAVEMWTPDDWALFCPDWTVRRLIEAPPPSEPGQRTVPRPRADWLDAPDTVTVTYAPVDLTPAELAAQLAAARAAKVAAIDAERDRRLALGALHAGKRFSMSDTSRTDMNGMATTAGLTIMGLLTWPQKYADGWIAMDNTRLPLPTPQDGIELGNAVGVLYAALVQHARTLKDAALGGNPTTVDEMAGWPD